MKTMKEYFKHWTQSLTNLINGDNKYIASLFLSSIISVAAPHQNSGNDTKSWKRRNRAKYSSRSVSETLFPTENLLNN